MALSASDLILPAGTLAPDLVPRTPDETETGDPATDTAKTTAYVGAFLAAAYADARVTALPTAEQDGSARAYAEWRAWQARADVLILMPRSGAVDGEGSYSYDAAQVSRAVSRAGELEQAFLFSVSGPTDAPRLRSVSVRKNVSWV